MVKITSLVNELLMKGGAFLAALALMTANFAANSTCMFPYYEPEQPEGLEKLKK